MSYKPVLLGLLLTIATLGTYYFISEYEANPKHQIISLPSFNLPFVEPNKTSFKIGSTNHFYKNKLTIVNLWATWCVACKKEEHIIQAINKSIISLHKANNKILKHVKNAELISIATKDKLDNLYKNKVIRKHLFPVLFDSKGIFAQQLKAHGLPQTYIFSKTGQLIKHYKGVLVDEDLTSILKLIREQ